MLTTQRKSHSRDGGWHMLCSRALTDMTSFHLSAKVYLYIHTYIYIYMCMYIYIYTYIYIYIYISIYIYIYLYLSISLYISLSIYLYIYIYIYIYTYIYIYIGCQVWGHAHLLPFILPLLFQYRCLIEGLRSGFRVSGLGFRVQGIVFTFWL